MRGPRSAICAAGIALLLSSSGSPFIYMRLSAPAFATPISQKIKEKQRLIEVTRQKLGASRQKLHAARFHVQSASQRLQSTQLAISRVNGAIGELSSTIAQTQTRLSAKRHVLAKTQARLDRHHDALNHRLVDVFENGPGSYLAVLFASSSFVDFIERWDFLRFIIRSDAALIASVNAEEARVQRFVAELETDERGLEAAQQEQERKHQELSLLAGERRQLLVQAQSERNAAAQQVVELENLSAAEESRLQQLIVEKQREDAEAVLRARLAAAQARRAAAMAAGVPLPEETGQGGAVLFMWPAHGPITSPFGMRTDPITGRYQLHSGIDIGAGYGAPIQASADGVVIFAGWYGGYGNAIIIDDGNGLSTLYAHCSAVYVAANQPIARGQVIGAVGSTGYSTGPHLHFEIRVNGVPVDPLSRL